MVSEDAIYADTEVNFSFGGYIATIAPAEQLDISRRSLFQIM